MNRRIFINNTIAAGMISFIPVNILEALSLKDKDIALDEDWMDNCDIIPAPDDPTLWEKWRNDLCIWRDRKKHQLNYNGSSYLSEPFKWVSSDFSCCFLMTCDT